MKYILIILLSFCYIQCSFARIDDIEQLKSQNEIIKHNMNILKYNLFEHIVFDYLKFRVYSTNIKDTEYVCKVENIKLKNIGAISTNSIHNELIVDFDFICEPYNYNQKNIIEIEMYMQIYANYEVSKLCKNNGYSKEIAFDEDITANIKDCALKLER